MRLTIVGVHVDGLAETQAEPVQFWTQDFDSNVTSCSTGKKKNKQTKDQQMYQHTSGDKLNNEWGSESALTLRRG